MTPRQREAWQLARAISAHHQRCGKRSHLVVAPGGAVRVDGYCGHAAERALFAALDRAAAK